MESDNQIAKFQEQLIVLGYNDCGPVVARKFVESTNGDFAAAVEKYFDNQSLYDERRYREGYRKLIAKKEAEMLAKNRDAPEEWIPKAIFEPEVVNIRRNEGELDANGKFEWAAIIRWRSKVGYGEADVDLLVEYIQSEGRGCHINTGVHGKLDANGKFEWAWEKEVGKFLSEDDLNAMKRTIETHPISKIYLPHAGVDTIDAFCYSWQKNLTEEKLDDVLDFYLDHQNIPSDRVKKDGGFEKLAREEEKRKELGAHKVDEAARLAAIKQ